MNLVQRLMMLVAMASSCWTLSAQDTEVARRDVPPTIVAAFEKAYPRAKVNEWDKEIHNGKLYYEAESVDGKVMRNVLYFPDARVAQVEEEIATKDIPTVVAEAVRRQYPSASIRLARKVTSGDVLEYALTLKGASQKRVVISANGTVASIEGKTAIDRAQ